jgi:hypothetical protein
MINMKMNILLNTRFLNHLQLASRPVLVCVSAVCLSACSTFYKADSTEPVINIEVSDSSGKAEQGVVDEVMSTIKTETKPTAESHSEAAVAVTSNEIKAELSDRADKANVNTELSVKKKKVDPVKTRPADTKTQKSPISANKKTADQAVSLRTQAHEPVASAPGNSIQSGISANVPVTLESLPLAIDEHWVLSREPASAGRCALFYREQKMNDGQGETPVQMIIRDTSILFATRSNIDLAYEQTGITLDQQAQIPIERVVNETDVLYEEHFVVIVDQMKAAQRLTLSLGYWPTWPMTQAYHVDFDLAGFSSAFSHLTKCIRLEQGLN